MAITVPEMRLLHQELAQEIGDRVDRAAMIPGVQTLKAFLAALQNRPTSISIIADVISEGPGGLPERLWSRKPRMMHPHFPGNTLNFLDYLRPDTWRSVVDFLQEMMSLLPEDLQRVGFVGSVPEALIQGLDWFDPVVGDFAAKMPREHAMLVRLFPAGWPGLKECSFGDLRYFVRYWAHRFGRLSYLNWLKQLNFPPNIDMVIGELVIKGRFFRMFMTGYFQVAGRMLVERVFKDANWFRAIRDAADIAGSGELGIIDVFKAYLGNPPSTTLADRVRSAWSEGYLRYIATIDRWELSRLGDHEVSPESVAMVIDFQPEDPANPPADHAALLGELADHPGLTDHLADERLGEDEKVIFVSEGVLNPRNLGLLVRFVNGDEMVETDPVTGEVVGPGPMLWIVFYKFWQQYFMNYYLRGLDTLPWPFGWVSSLRDLFERIFPAHLTFPLVIPLILKIMFGWGLPWSWSWALATPFALRGIFGWLAGHPYRVTLDNWLDIPGHFWGIWKAQGILRYLGQKIGMMAGDDAEIPVGPDIPAVYVVGVVAGALAGLVLWIYTDNFSSVWHMAWAYGIVGTSIMMAYNVAASRISGGRAFYLTPRFVFFAHIVVALVSIFVFIARPGWTPPHL